MTWQQYLATLDNRRHGVGLAPGVVPETSLLAVVDNHGSWQLLMGAALLCFLPAPWVARILPFRRAHGAASAREAPS